MLVIAYSSNLCVSAGDIRQITVKEFAHALDHVLPEAREQTPQQRVAVIGFDGFTFRILDQLLTRGEMPNFAKIVAEGTRIALKSTDFPSSAVAWPVIATGCKQEATGIHSFFQLNPETYKFDLVSASFRSRKAFWEIASESGKRSIIINVPITYPPDAIDGIMVSGLLSPENSVFTIPPQMSPILRRLGYKTGYQSFKNTISLGDFAFNPSGQIIDVNDLFDMTFNRFNLGRYLMNALDWDLFMTVFTLPDRLQHNTGVLGDEVIHHAYRQMDVLLGAILKELPEQTSLFVISDHGFRPFIPDKKCH